MQVRLAVKGEDAMLHPLYFVLTSGLPGLQRAGPSAPLDEVLFNFNAVYQRGATASITLSTTAIVFVFLVAARSLPTVSRLDS